MSIVRNKAVGILFTSWLGGLRPSALYFRKKYPNSFITVLLNMCGNGIEKGFKGVLFCF